MVSYPHIPPSAFLQLIGNGFRDRLVLRRLGEDEDSCLHAVFLATVCGFSNINYLFVLPGTMGTKDTIIDDETLRSFSRMAYGHEIWLDEIEKDGDEVSVYGLYGHKMLPDKPMPTDYANVLLYDDNGRVENPEREIVNKPSGWRFTFNDAGADVYTMYVDSNSTWVTNEEGWHRGSKRNYDNVTYSGAFNMVAKRIVSKDAADPGNVMHAALEIMPGRAVLEQGKTATVRVLYEEKPMKGIKCTIYNRDWQDLLMTKTDEEGKVSFVADKPGMYVVIAKYTDESKAVSDEFDETSFTTTLTIDCE